MATQSFTAELGDSNVERARDVGEGIAQALVSFVRRFQAWQARAAAASALYEMSDRELRDIGITRGEIDQALKGRPVEAGAVVAANDALPVAPVANQNRPRLVA